MNDTGSGHVVAFIDFNECLKRGEVPPVPRSREVAIDLNGLHQWPRGVREMLAARMNDGKVASKADPRSVLRVNAATLDDLLSAIWADEAAFLVKESQRLRDEADDILEHEHMVQCLLEQDIEDWLAERTERNGSRVWYVSVNHAIDPRLSSKGKAALEIATQRNAETDRAAREFADRIMAQAVQSPVVRKPPRKKTPARKRSPAKKKAAAKKKAGRK